MGLRRSRAHPHLWCRRTRKFPLLIQTRPAEPDDLTRLAGIGPVFSERLRDAGITTFSQLAALDEEQIAEALDWSASRVARERLRERAEGIG